MVIKQKNVKNYTTVYACSDDSMDDKHHCQTMPFTITKNTVLFNTYRIIFISSMMVSKYMLRPKQETYRSIF